MLPPHTPGSSWGMDAPTGTFHAQCAGIPILRITLGGPGQSQSRALTTPGLQNSGLDLGPLGRPVQP